MSKPLELLRAELEDVLCEKWHVPLSVIDREDAARTLKHLQILGLKQELGGGKEPSTDAPASRVRPLTAEQEMERSLLNFTSVLPVEVGEALDGE